MAGDKIDVIRSSSSGSIGRAVNEARGIRALWDSSSKPQPDAMTNSEAFLGSISSCGVTLIEMYAADKGIPLTRMDVTIEGVRTAEDPSRFARIAMRYELAGVTQAQADELVEVWRRR
jgi:uncharacterized OsmC-like protein